MPDDFHDQNLQQKKLQIAHLKDALDIAEESSKKALQQELRQAEDDLRNLMENSDTVLELSDIEAYRSLLPYFYLSSNDPFTILEEQYSAEETQLLSGKISVEQFLENIYKKIRTIEGELE